MLRILSVLAVAATGFWAIPDPTSPDPNTVRPIEAADTVFTEDMTWMEIRDAIHAGKNTVIIATGGIEQNGPYLVTGKHNIVLRATTEALARKLGNALVAPIIPFVPEGNINPPTEHMRYPGSISLTEETYERLLTEICECFRTHGFKHIVLIGDSGGNQKGLKAVARQLNQQDDGRGRVHYIPEYYNYGEVAEWLEKRGIKQVSEGLHDDYGMTAMMMSVDYDSIRMKQRLAAGKFRINGVKLAPVERTVEIGRRLIDFRADQAFRAARKSIAAAERR